MIKAIIFDIDGVLVDSFDANVEYFTEIFEVAGYVSPTKKEYVHMYHMPLEQILRFVAKDPEPEEFERIMKISKATVYPTEKMKLAAGSQDTIKNLMERYKLAIVTGRNEYGTDDYLEHAGLKKYFETVVHYGHYANPKPDPEPLMVALERLGVGPEEAVYVGDQKTDWESASAAGVAFILRSDFDYGLQGIQHVAEDFLAIPALIEEIQRSAKIT